MLTCANCKNFIRIGDTPRGRCKVRKYLMSRQKRETNIEFLPYQSRRVCKQFFEEGKTITRFEQIKSMTVDDMVKGICDSGLCESFCAFTKDGKCNNVGGKEMCSVGVRLWLESEVVFTQPTFAIMEKGKMLNG